MNKNIVIGVHPILEAIKKGKSINKVFIKRGLRNNDILLSLKKRNIPFSFVPLEKLNRFTRSNHQGVVAIISPIDFYDIEDIVPFLYENSQNPFIAILDRVTDIRNFGAIIRSAECFGVNAILVPYKNTADISEDLVKTSAGSIYNINICRTNSLLSSIDFLKKSGINIVGISEKADKSLSDIDFSIPTAVIMGSEGLGIHNSIRRVVQDEAKIDMLGQTNSLNVSVAAGITFYEVIRQRLSIK